MDAESKFSIELDCAPGSPRPDDLFPGVIEGTELKISDFEIVSRLFGNWMFELKAGKARAASFVSAKATLRKRVEALYHTGAIRYGSW